MKITIEIVVDSQAMRKNQSNEIQKLLTDLARSLAFSGFGVGDNDELLDSDGIVVGRCVVSEQNAKEG